MSFLNRPLPGHDVQNPSENVKANQQCRDSNVHLFEPLVVFVHEVQKEDGDTPATHRRRNSDFEREHGRAPVVEKTTKCIIKYI